MKPQKGTKVTKQKDEQDGIIPSAFLRLLCLFVA